MLSKKAVTRLILITAFFYDPTDTPETSARTHIALDVVEKAL